MWDNNSGLQIRKNRCTIKQRKTPNGYDTKIRLILTKITFQTKKLHKFQKIHIQKTTSTQPAQQTRHNQQQNETKRNSTLSAQPQRPTAIRASRILASL
jgi:hypothetical protein